MAQAVAWSKVFHSQVHSSPGSTAPPSAPLSWSLLLKTCQYLGSYRLLAISTLFIPKEGYLISVISLYCCLVFFSSVYLLRIEDNYHVIYGHLRISVGIWILMHVGLFCYARVTWLTGDSDCSLCTCFFFAWLKTKHSSFQLMCLICCCNWENGCEGLSGKSERNIAWGREITLSPCVETSVYLLFLKRS